MTTARSCSVAGCYESHVRYPTDVKLLWECCEWVSEKATFPYCSRLGISRPRSRYTEQCRKQPAYSRRRRKSLLHLLGKGLGRLQVLLDGHPDEHLPDRAFARLRTIKKVYTQQLAAFGSSSVSIPDRIVSLAKPYLRPIVRGRENKRVEFGMKAHIFQAGGISFVDRFSFDAFNESARLKLTYAKHKWLFGACHQLGADGIYATNTNRRVMARTGATEKLWVFFGIMTANAMAIAKRQLSIY